MAAREDIDRAVVTGARGFIGSCLVGYLKSKHIEVVGIDRPSTQNDSSIIGLDINHPSALSPYLNDGTVVFHMAGSADIHGSVVDPWSDFQSNVALTLSVLESVRRAGCSMLFPSTGSVYDTLSPVPFNENSPLKPLSPYSAAKLAVEGYCSVFRNRYSLDIRIARIFSVFGPGMSRFAIYDFFKRLQHDPKKLTIKGDGGQTRDYLFVEDVARALVTIMIQGEDGGIYNVASGTPRRIYDVARAVVQTMGLTDCDIQTLNNSNHEEIYAMEADVSRISKIGFNVDDNFEKRLRATVNWLKDN